MNSSSTKHSISEIQTYLDCRRKHGYRYRLKVASSVQSAPLIRGTAVHCGTEKAANYLMAGESLNETACVQLAWDKANEEVLGLEQEIESAVLAGVDCLRELSADGHEILEVERLFEQSFGTWNTKGQIDLVTRQEHALHVLDWKTCATLPSHTGFNLDPQVASYAWRAMEDYGVDECYAGRIYLRCAPKNIKITKLGKVAATSVTDYRGYRKWIAKHPETAIDDTKARARFGNWYRIDSMLLHKRMCASILEQMEKVAAEIDQNLEPHPNFRPKMCGWCEYSTACMAHTLTGQFDPGAGYDVEWPAQ